MRTQVAIDFLSLLHSPRADNVVRYHTLGAGDIGLFVAELGSVASPFDETD
jgi:hypothetical protein